MTNPDDRLLSEYDEEVLDSSSAPEMLDEADELEFESADADTANELIDSDDSDQNDEGFGFGDPAE